MDCGEQCSSRRNWSHIRFVDSRTSVMKKEDKNIHPLTLFEKKKVTQNSYIYGVSINYLKSILGVTLGHPAESALPFTALVN